MKLTNSTADIFVPDGKPISEAMPRITHLGIGAHQDDLEFMAFHGILDCFNREDRWFGGVTCTNGSGSSRTGPYAGTSDRQMMDIRRQEQRLAAVIGQFGAMFQLDHPSSAVKSASDTALRRDLREILAAAKPEVVYTHNLADKHDTHIGVVVAAIEAIREMPRPERPSKVWGCEIWRNLDWMLDSEKIIMDVSGRDNLAAALSGVFDSQISGGKRYDLATLGRRAANATFFESHSTDKSSQVIFGIDLTPLAADETLDIGDYACGFIQRFEQDVRQRIGKRLGRK
jgi:LmbE family N-acetylglucosaminyl deacetylase